MIDTKEVEKVIPHRGDMRLIDEISEITDTTATGIKHVTDHEFWHDGHFPAHAIMPGVLIVEAMAQTACFMTLNRAFSAARHTFCSPPWGQARGTPLYRRPAYHDRPPPVGKLN